MEREGRRPAGRIALLAALLALGALAVASAPAAHANQLTEIQIPDRNGEIPDKWLGYPGPPRARVLLPDGYDPARAYPLLVLVAGFNSNYKTWSDPRYGRIETTAAGFPGIIVMPEGADGFYTDWWNNGKRGDPSWESYYTDEVIPQILERYRIRPERSMHALAGVSMGGLGTAYLGSRLPGFFGSIALISPVLNTHEIIGEGIAISFLAHGATVPFDPEAVYGPPFGFYSYGHNPVNLAGNLADTRVFMAAGNGIPTSDGEPNPNNPVSDPLGEAVLVRPTSDQFAAALSAAHVDYTYQPHDGLHDNANFRQELRDAIQWGLFKPVDEHAASWVNDTVATHGKLWEFAFRFDSPPDRLVRFRRNGSQLEIGAAGSAVTIRTDGGCTFHAATPAIIPVPEQPCARLAVSLRPRRLKAGRSRRVRVRVTPAAPGAVVRWGTREFATNDAGVARLRICARRSRTRRVWAGAPNFLPASATLAVRGRPRGCVPR
jgi:S-formylglutathione hydrolase FrmB